MTLLTQSEEVYREAISSGSPDPLQAAEHAANVQNGVRANPRQSFSSTTSLESVLERARSRIQGTTNEHVMIIPTNSFFSNLLCHFVNAFLEEAGSVASLWHFFVALVDEVLKL